MEAKITQIGNSQEIIISKAIIEQCGFTQKVNLELKNNILITIY